ncbi:hypothetical protein KsCSTR_23510 [Candidatus Kuenenia stuttgartiensis]|jgi:hypothetical protein|uniref:NHL repeat protein n=1 Tax=Kuenenia stuttgartiensis TaxID=174633 RepID=Q1Q3N7_KUEST|nr:hypothetical protein [Candidatus Kuenenia stuttgartiensis]QII11730.1 hypothetical protein KsCSTR_23510 [Candidatus Kuenenia stuttgartiensis]CAJ74619.1 unknown protein [Candidatus Kuenenia stuttgartiensis]
MRENKRLIGIPMLVLLVIVFLSGSFFYGHETSGKYVSAAIPDGLSENHSEYNRNQEEPPAMVELFHQLMEKRRGDHTALKAASQHPVLERNGIKGKGKRPANYRRGRGITPYGKSNTSEADSITAKTKTNELLSSNGGGDMEYQFLFKFGFLSLVDGEFRLPSGVATDSAGNIIVADTDNHRIQIFDSSGVFLRGAFPIFCKKTISRG